MQLDGVFGPYTEAAVQAFQAWFGLAIDGVAGALTWSAWAFWHFLEGAPAVLITVTVASLVADNDRLRKRLASVLRDGMRPGPGAPEAPDARPGSRPGS